MTNEEAIEIIRNLFNMQGIDALTREELTALTIAIKALEQTRWIPVSERLPKNDEDVLVCYPQGGMEVVYYHIDNSIYPMEYADLNETGWCDEKGEALYFEPIAWMPLSEPYKAESEEKE